MEKPTFIQQPAIYVYKPICLLPKPLLLFWNHLSIAGKFCPDRHGFQMEKRENQTLSMHVCEVSVREIDGILGMYSPWTCLTVFKESFLYFLNHSLNLAVSLSMITV